MSRDRLRNRVLGALVRGPMTVAEIRRRLKSGPNTTLNAVTTLLASKRIEAAPPQARGRGHGRDKPYRLAARVE